MTICPTSALEKRPDGIVDIDPKACIGCKSCMHGCPYDALYIDEEHGTAEKCHFCAHRTEVGLAPACAVVCPTEAIIPGDFDDPDSLVSRLRREENLTARKVQAGTGPNVHYRGATPGRYRSAPDPQRPRPDLGRPAPRSADGHARVRRARGQGQGAHDLRRRPSAAVGREDHRLPVRQVAGGRRVPGGPDRSRLAVLLDPRAGDPRPVDGPDRRAGPGDPVPRADLAAAGLRPEAARALPLHPQAPQLQLLAGPRDLRADRVRRAARPVDAARYRRRDRPPRARPAATRHGRHGRTRGLLHGLPLRPGQGPRAVDGGAVSGCT